MASQPPLATAAGQMIPNRHQLALDPAEQLAEGANAQRMREAARATGNWSVMSILVALADEALQRKKTKQGRRA
jgi:hypothetical protein